MAGLRGSVNAVPRGLERDGNTRPQDALIGPGGWGAGGSLGGSPSGGAGSGGGSPRVATGRPLAGAYQTA